MKKFKEVEKTRILSHKDPARDSVHRSSLLVPEISGASAEISFLNHFLIKRGYAHVACRITAIDDAGARIESRLHPVDEPRVYRFPLTGSFPKAAASYMVEFFAAENLFIPFPAVMVNHHGPGFFNTVHAFNRVLNDVFEDDAINANHPPEASIDVDVSRGRDTFVVFAAGATRCQGALEVELTGAQGVRRVSVPMDVPRFGQRVISIREILPDLPESATGVLRVRQPSQFLFYGRMLTGVRSPEGAFSANHSYYDTSAAPEYWEDGRTSYRAYPCFRSFRTKIRMYPIQAPGRLAVSVGLHAESGKELVRVPVGALESPGSGYLEVDVGDLGQDEGVSGEARSFVVYADAGGSPVPCRVNHQLAYSGGALSSSINVSLFNPNVYAPAGKAGRTWGQALFGRGLDSRLAVVGDAPAGEPADVELAFYDETGKVADLRRRLEPGGAVEVDPASDLGLDPMAEGVRPVWVMVQCDRPDISLFFVNRDRASGHCSGEHGF